MKRNPREPYQTGDISGKKTGTELSKTSSDGLVQIVLYIVLLLTAVIVQTGRMTMVLLAVAFLVTLPVGEKVLKNLRQRLSIPLIGLMAFAVLYGAAAIYSPFDTEAVAELYKFLAAFSLGSILLARFEKRHIRGLLWGIALVCAVISFLSIDMTAQGAFFRVFERIVTETGVSFSDVVHVAGRVSGIYGDANVTANLFALGSLISLYLITTETVRKNTVLAFVLLGGCAQGFILSMSRGAMVIFAVALLVWMIAAEKEIRLRLFLLAFVSAVVTVAISGAAMSAVSLGTLLSVLLMTVPGGLIFLLDQLLNVRISRLLEGRGKLAVAVTSAIVALCAVYAVAAMTITTAYKFDDSAYLSRTVSLSSGEYEVSGSWDDRVYVWVVAKTESDVLMGRGNEVYSGPLLGATFTMPEKSVQAEFRFNGVPGTEIQSLTLSDGTQVPLAYPLMPEFLAARIQGGVFADNSVLLRLQYMEDALKLFAQRPLWGHGLGSTENLYPSVQPFFYESRYVHNHVLQIMSDMGLFGVIGFLTFLGGVLWLLLRRLRKERDGLAAMLLACWVMINLHSLMEINFSVRGYQCVAYSVLMLPVLLYANPLSGKKEFARWGGRLVAGLLSLYLMVSWILLQNHYKVERDSYEFSTSNAVEFMETLKSYIRKDVLVQNQNKLTFVGNAILFEDGRYDREMLRWVEDLREGGTYTACSGLARYYYLPRGEYEEMFACSREGIAQVASLEDGWNRQLDFYREDVLAAITPEDMDVYLDGVMALDAYLEEYSQDHADKISLTEENRQFLLTVKSLRENNVPGEAAYHLLVTAMLAVPEN